MKQRFLAALAACLVIGMPDVKDAAALTGENSIARTAFDHDATGQNWLLCNGPCAANLPPLMAGDSSRIGGEYTVVARGDSKKHWALKGNPLY